MAAIRKTMLQLGLLSMPVEVCSTVPARTSLATVCVAGHEPTRISQQRWCKACEGPPVQTAKARAVGDRFIVVSEEEVAKAKDAAKPFAGAIKLAVVDRKQLLADTFPSGAAYWLAPGTGASAKAYASFVAAVRANPGEALVAVFTLKTSESLFWLVERDGALLLQALAWPGEVHAAPAVPAGKLSQAEARLVRDLVAAAKRDWNAAAYTEQAAEAVDALFAGREPAGGTAAVAATDGTDLLAVLAASVAAAKPPAKRATKAKQAAKPRTRKPKAEPAAAEPAEEVAPATLKAVS